MPLTIINICLVDVYKPHCGTVSHYGVCLTGAFPLDPPADGRPFFSRAEQRPQRKTTPVSHCVDSYIQSIRHECEDVLFGRNARLLGAGWKCADELGKEATLTVALRWDAFIT